MNTFTTAMTALAVIIGFGQLAASMAMLSSKIRTQMINHVLWLFMIFMMAFMLLSGVFGFVSFAITESPRKIDYLLLAAGAANHVFSMVFVLVLALARRVKRIENHISDVRP